MNSIKISEGNSSMYDKSNINYTSTSNALNLSIVSDKYKSIFSDINNNKANGFISNKLVNSNSYTPVLNKSNSNNNISYSQYLHSINNKNRIGSLNRYMNDKNTLTREFSTFSNNKNTSNTKTNLQEDHIFPNKRKTSSFNYKREEVQSIHGNTKEEEKDIISNTRKDFKESIKIFPSDSRRKSRLIKKSFTSKVNDNTSEINLNIEGKIKDKIKESHSTVNLQELNKEYNINSDNNAFKTSKTKKSDKVNTAIKFNTYDMKESSKNNKNLNRFKTLEKLIINKLQDNCELKTYKNSNVNNDKASQSNNEDGSTGLTHRIVSNHHSNKKMGNKINSTIINNVNELIPSHNKNNIRESNQSAQSQQISNSINTNTNNNNNNNFITTNNNSQFTFRGKVSKTSFNSLLKNNSIKSNLKESNKEILNNDGTSRDTNVNIVKFNLADNLKSINCNVNIGNNTEQIATNDFASGSAENNFKIQIESILTPKHSSLQKLLQKTEKSIIRRNDTEASVNQHSNENNNDNYKDIKTVSNKETYATILTNNNLSKINISNLINTNYSVTTDSKGSNMYNNEEKNNKKFTYSSIKNDNSSKLVSMFPKPIDHNLKDRNNINSNKSNNSDNNTSNKESKNNIIQIKENTHDIKNSHSSKIRNDLKSSNLQLNSNYMESLYSRKSNISNRNYDDEIDSIDEDDDIDEAMKNCNEENEEKHGVINSTKKLYYKKAVNLFKQLVKNVISFSNDFEEYNSKETIKMTHQSKGILNTLSKRENDNFFFESVDNNILQESARSDSLNALSQIKQVMKVNASNNFLSKIKHPNSEYNQEESKSSFNNILLPEYINDNNNSNHNHNLGLPNTSSLSSLKLNNFFNNNSNTFGGNIPNLNSLSHIQVNNNLNNLQSNYDNNIESNNNNNSIVKTTSQTNYLDSKLRKLTEFNNNISNKINALKDKFNKLPKIRLSYDNLIFMKLRNFENLVSFLGNRENAMLYSLTKQLKDKYIEMISFKCSNVISMFSAKYKMYFEILKTNLILNRYFKNKHSRDNKTANIQATLVLVAKIFNQELEDKTVTIRYFSKYSSDKEVHNNSFKFDVKKKQPLSFWILKEYTVFHTDASNKAYFQPIMPFQVDDKIELSIPIFNELGLLEITKIKQNYLDMGSQIIPTFTWKTLSIKQYTDYDIFNVNSDVSNLNKLKAKEVLDFDLTRYCELEFIKNNWIYLESRDPTNKTLKIIDSVFNPYFLVKHVFCDDVGYIIYKIILTANKSGKLLLNSNKSGLVYDSNTDYFLKSSNKETEKEEKNATILDNIGISLIVLENNKSITNEVKKNFLIYDRKNCVQCRVGDTIVFYFTKN